MAFAVAQSAQPVACDEPFCYHDVTRPGFAPVLRKMPNGKMKQRPIWLSDLPRNLEGFYGEEDVWISQCEFFKPDRRVVNLWRMPLAFADLDTYKVDDLRSKPPEMVTAMLLAWCEDKHIPPPSLVVFSGRGLQVKWLFTQPVPRRTLPRWQAVQRVLNSQLAPFGADKQALDASRVLRLVNTRSSRSGETVRVIHEQRTPTLGGELLSTGLVGYDFEVLADTILPMARAELDAIHAQQQARRIEDARAQAERENRKAELRLIQGGADNERAPNNRRLIPSQLAWARLDDLRTLARLRGFDQGAPEGQRNLFVFLGACFLADACIAPNLLPEVVELASEFAPTWSHEELMSCVSAVMRRAQDAARGKTVTYCGFKRNPRYRWTNEMLVERLSITAEEERHLKTIVSQHEARRRNTEQHAAARRAKGMLPREEYLAQVEKQRQEARAYRAAKWSLKAIAEKLGVAVSTVSGYCKE